MKAQGLLSQLENTQQAVESTVSTCLKEKKISVLKKSLASAQTVISQTLETFPNRKRSLSKTKKSLVALRNVVTGLLEGLADGEFNSVKEFRAICSNVEKKFLPQYTEAYTSELQRALDKTQDADSSTEDDSDSESEIPSPLIEAKKAVAASADWHHILGIFKGAMTKKSAKVSEKADGKPWEQTDEEISQRLESVQSKYEELPRTLKQEYQFMRMPIVPLFKNLGVSTKQNFDKLGIPNINIQGYSILENQILLGISRKSVDALNVGKKKKDEKSTPADFAKTVLEVVNERTNAKYVLVSDKFQTNPKNADILLFWVMPTRLLSALIKSAGLGSSEVKEWGLPFNR